MSKLLEVARLAGVSKSTVSRVINNHKSVSPIIRLKVIEAMQKLKFQPQELKRSPDSSTVLGLILPFGKQILGHSFGVDIFIGAEEKAFEQNYMILTGNSIGGREQALTANMVHRGVEGLIVLSNRQGQSEHLKDLKAQGIPLVLVDQKVEGLGAHLVRGDNFMGAVTLTTHLLEQGHRRIGLVSPFQHFTHKERTKGYRYALMEQNINLQDSFEAIEYEREDASIQLDRMLSMENRPTALFVTAPGMLGKVIGILNKKQLRIPEDISIVTFDESYSVHPEGYQDFFTSINQSGKLMGSMAVELLFRQIRDPELIPQEIVLPGTFTSRGSVRSLL